MLKVCKSLVFFFKIYKKTNFSTIQTVESLAWSHSGGVADSTVCVLLKKYYDTCRNIQGIILNRQGVAGAVLQTPLSIIHYFID